MSILTKDQALTKMLADADKTISEAVNFLRQNDVDYQLGEWVTIKRYCEKFDIANTQTISNWINRGIIPAENIVEIKELNNIKLIKAMNYQD